MVFVLWCFDSSRTGGLDGVNRRRATGQSLTW